VVKYWQETGKSGFKVWRYLFRRDDPEPAPWTKQGKKKIEELGLEMKYPDGYLEAQKKKELEKSAKKRKPSDENEPSETPASQTPKKMKTSYKVPKEVMTSIKQDVGNKKVWDEVLECREKGHSGFFEKLQEMFACVCCQDLVFQPITTECSHNICKGCLQRSFKAEVYSCPMCRADLGQDYKMEVNRNLRDALLKLCPGYEQGR